MWICDKCGDRNADQINACARCSMPRLSPPAGEEDTSGAPAPRWQLRYEVFRGVFASWDVLFRQAAAFANRLGPERVVSISHSEDENDGVVTVWYWVSSDDPPSLAT
jgi:ribosomal protein L40E